MARCWDRAGRARLVQRLVPHAPLGVGRIDARCIKFDKIIFIELTGHPLIIDIDSQLLAQVKYPDLFKINGIDLARRKSLGQ